MNDYDFLRKIMKCKKYNYDRASKMEQDALDRLIKSGHISYEIEDKTNRSICRITSLGANFIYEEKMKNRKWAFTTWISIFALAISTLTLIVQLIK